MLKPIINIYQDTRRAKGNGLYPIKLRVYLSSGEQRKQKLYPLGIDLTIEDFERSYLAPKPRGDFKDLKLELIAKEKHAYEILDGMKVFTFEKFERELFREKYADGDAAYHYRSYISKLQAAGKVTTASNYDLSLKSLLAFVNSHGRKETKNLFFDSITVDFLNRYERWMLSKGKSRTTVGIYLRPLRCIFNLALEEGDIIRDTYPFGKRKYQIPAGRNLKKALGKEQLGKLFSFEPLVPDQVKARDFWFFSYACNGMNVKDIANLRYGDLQEDRLVFTRAKTADTSKANQKPILVPLSFFPLSMIERYGNKNKSRDNYVFPILSKGMDATQQDRAVKNFTRYINQHIKPLAKAAGVTGDISTYWARHSYATNAVRHGASLEMIQESLGHSDIKTTMHYWSGFEESVKREISDKLMDFSVGEEAAQAEVTP
ncbi:tyrosine-type recombinase/integrase [Pontibacter kalidii]|uniref:tyrosine-type recombinase/integrase n=1 Tax=Pontibacter kalidii TaxID=2592049 RepID=UPI002258AC81|nr:site-specific integrase [Pontibacter kalidii]